MNLGDIKIIINRIGFFKNFLKISGIVPHLEFGFSNRFIGVKFLEFLGEKSLTLVRNTINNLNASYFANVKTFEINALSSNITLKNSICRGDYLTSNENYKFFKSEKSRALFFNLNLFDIKIGEVRVKCFNF